MAGLETQSIFHMQPDEEHEARLDAAAMAAYRAGAYFPHARVQEWLAALSRGERVPPPQA